MRSREWHRALEGFLSEGFGSEDIALKLTASGHTTGLLEVRHTIRNIREEGRIAEVLRLKEGQNE